MTTTTATETRAMTIYTLTCRMTGETQSVCICPTHAREMPLIDRDRVRAEPADDGIACELCPVTAPPKKRKRSVDPLAAFFRRDSQ